MLEPEVAERGGIPNLETHLCKHLGSVSLGPAGGAQGNKQLWFENLAALFGVPGKQGCERDGIIYYCPLSPCVYLLSFKNPPLSSPAHI